MPKKLKKDIKGLTKVTLLGSGAALGLGSIGGDIASKGAAGISGATSVAPTIGTMMGAGMLIRTTSKLIPKEKKKKRIRL